MDLLILFTLGGCLGLYLGMTVRDRYWQERIDKMPQEPADVKALRARIEELEAPTPTTPGLAVNPHIAAALALANVSSSVQIRVYPHNQVEGMCPTCADVLRSRKELPVNDRVYQEMHCKCGNRIVTLGFVLPPKK